MILNPPKILCLSLHSVDLKIIYFWKSISTFRNQDINAVQEVRASLSTLPGLHTNINCLSGHQFRAGLVEPSWVQVSELKSSEQDKDKDSSKICWGKLLASGHYQFTLKTKIIALWDLAKSSAHNISQMIEDSLIKLIAM